MVKLTKKQIRDNRRCASVSKTAAGDDELLTFSEAAAGQSFNYSTLSGLASLDRMDEELGLKPLKVGRAEFAELTSRS